MKITIKPPIPPPTRYYSIEDMTQDELNVICGALSEVAYGSFHQFKKDRHAAALLYSELVRSRTIL